MPEVGELESREVEAPAEYCGFRGIDCYERATPGIFNWILVEVWVVVDSLDEEY